VSPHSPYTVSGPLFRAVAAWSRAEQLPLAVHVAESRAEVQLLLAGSGPFAEALRDRGVPLPSPQGHSPISWLVEHDVLSTLALCIHAVQAASDDIQRLADSGAAVAHCPVSNQVHGHGAAPVAAMLKAGVRVGLGTDSVVSVGRLDLLAEARLTGRLADLDANRLLELCTLDGARAIGIEANTGSLEVGKWADCTVIRLPRTGNSPVARVLASSPADVLLTCVAGKEVYRTS
jgi:cytosine/adenosine deaminase-related metal-dependent hydrolase